MIKLEINGIEFLVQSNFSVLEACKFVGINIPRFCYHETLSIAGNCRMCVVEVFNSPKPVASCALPVLNNMKIFTDTPLVKKARENVLETLLLNHPLDCPICDQGGECDLQDQAKEFGTDYSRFFFKKRGVEDKYMGPLIKTIMTRCIHCTRCIRFNTEIAGGDSLGTLNRGKFTEIGGYLSNIIKSEISANIIDICPVGALTSKSYSFKSRPWELRNTESIDLTDSLGSNLNINYKETEILRIFPKINFDLNGSIISDKSRYSFDSNKFQRLTKIFKHTKTSTIQLDWIKTLQIIDSLLKDNTKKILFVINDEIDFESLVNLKLLTRSFRNKIKIQYSTNKQIKQNIHIGNLSNKILEIKTISQLGIIISSNLRVENTILNTKLRVKYYNENLEIFGLGQTAQLNYPIQFINLKIDSLISIFESKNIKLSKLLIKSKTPLIFIGENISKRGLSILNFNLFIRKIIPTAIIINLKNSCNSLSLEFFNFSFINNKKITSSDIIFFFNLNDSLITSKFFFNSKNKFLIWLNTHGSNLALKANISIPLISEYEAENIYINLENRPQKTFKSISSLNDSRSIKDIVLNLFYTNFKPQLKNKSINFIKEIINTPELFNRNINIFSKQFFFNYKTILEQYPQKSNTEDFYISTKTLKNSQQMLKCSQEYRKNSNNFFL